MSRGLLVFAAVAATAALAAFGVQPTRAQSARDLAADTARLPKTDIFLAPASFARGVFNVGAFRPAVKTPGYDNQPSFLPGGAAFYFVSEGENGKTDIWRYDVKRRAATRFYASPSISEYSPQAAPHGYGVSYIQENETAEITRVHHAPADGGPGAAVIDFAPLGYYAWLNNGATLAVYLRGGTPALYLVDVASGKRRLIAEHIGRALHASPDGRRLYFTEENASGGYRIMLLDPANDAMTPMIDLPDGVEDFAVLSVNGVFHGLLAAKGPLLYISTDGDGALDWKPAGEFSNDGVMSISRIAVSDDGAWIAVVTDSQ